MLRTPLYDSNVSLGARMVPFAGWSMPVSYPTGTVPEVRACRAAMGLFDVSHMGELLVKGPGSADALQYITSNNVRKLQPGTAQYSLLLNPSGGIKDDIIVYCNSEDDFLVVVNASCHEKDREWLALCLREWVDIRLEDVSAATALIAVQGPHAVTTVASICSHDVSKLERFTFARADVAGVPCMVSRTGYTGEDGFELFTPWDSAQLVWDNLVSLGAVPCGLGARDVLRLEAGYSLYGHELDEECDPAESGVGWAVKRKKGDFVGATALATRLESPHRQSMVALRMDEPPNAIAREGCPVLGADGACIGRVTSGTLSPTVGRGIAMARAQASEASVGAKIAVDIRGRVVPCTVIELPFYRNGV